MPQKDEAAPMTVPFGRTLNMLIDAITTDANRRILEAIEAAAQERAYDLATVRADVGQRAWLVPDSDGAA